MSASEAVADKYFTVDAVSNISSDDSSVLRSMLDAVEQRTTNWIKNDKWKHHKTVQNQINLSEDVGEYNDIAVYKLLDNDFHPKISIWKVEAFVPEPNSKEILKYYNVPTVRTQFDNDAMSTFYEIPIRLTCVCQMLSVCVRYAHTKQESKENDDSKNEEEPQDDHAPKICMNVCKTLPAAKGWISPRIFMQIVEVKYCKATNEHCTISTFIPNEIVNKKEIREVLQIKDEDLKTNVIGQNLSLYLGVKRVEKTKYTKVT